MHSSDSNGAFKLFSANRSQGGFTMMNWDPRRKVLSPGSAPNLFVVGEKGLAGESAECKLVSC